MNDNDQTSPLNSADDLLPHRSSPRVSSQDTEEKLKDKMRDIELKKQEELTEQRGVVLKTPYINLFGFPVSAKVLALVSEEEALEFRVLPFFHSHNQIRIAAVYPESAGTRKIIANLAKRFPDSEIVAYITSEESFSKAVKLYKTVAKFRPFVRDIIISKEHIAKFKKEIPTLAVLNEKLQLGNLSEKFVMLIAAAMNSLSSDIHIEAEEKNITVRFRVDGLLQNVASLPKEIWPQLIARIKAVAGLKININTVPQDGRVTIDLDENERLDIRVSTLPSAFGESIVMRLLSSKVKTVSFEELGLRGKAFHDLKRETERPNGMIITTGPTGSGKTTTMYSILSRLNKPEVKIITLEDPIEYKLPGVTQSQVDVSRDYTFVKGLRSILRQDPDIVLVGEIRDLETADIAIQAALTGHLVLSTIHTNDASGAIPRFLSMGVKPFLLAPAINSVIGQRLVRKICEHCKKPDNTVDAEQMERIKGILADIPVSADAKKNIDTMTFYRGVGCEQCYQGYRGRVGIFEIFSMNEEIEKVILSGNVAEYQMKDLAHEYGMITMVQDGLLKALDGLTTVEEVFRVTE